MHTKALDGFDFLSGMNDGSIVDNTYSLLTLAIICVSNCNSIKLLIDFLTPERVALASSDSKY